VSVKYSIFLLCQIGIFQVGQRDEQFHWNCPHHLLHFFSLSLADSFSGSKLSDNVSCVATSRSISSIKRRLPVIRFDNGYEHPPNSYAYPNLALLICDFASTRYTSFSISSFATLLSESNEKFKKHIRMNCNYMLSHLDKYNERSLRIVQNTDKVSFLFD
jgi:hypothetical protein